MMKMNTSASSSVLLVYPRKVKRGAYVFAILFLLTAIVREYVLAILFLLAAIITRVIFTSIPTKLGFFRYIASRSPQMAGLTPAFCYGVEPGYTFEKLYENNLNGKNALVTGANSGIGYDISLALARLGASVTLACRNESRCNDAANKLRADDRVQESTDISTMLVDTSSLSSVRDFSQQFKEQHEKLDMLFMNAGIGTAGVNDDGSAPLSVDGIEMVFATNLVGHHLLYKWLDPLLNKSESPRIVLTSSSATFGNSLLKDSITTDIETLNSVQIPGSDFKFHYGRSKLGQIYWAKELGSSSPIYANAFYPGVVSSPVWTEEIPNGSSIAEVVQYLLDNDIMWNATEASLTALYLGVSEEVVTKNIRGKYFHPIAQEVVNPLAQDKELQTKLWTFLDELVEDYLPEN